MGILAPTNYDYFQLAITALISYNRPWILLAVFLLVLFLGWWLFKKVFGLAFLLAFVIVIILAAYFVFSFLSALRF